MGLDNNDVILPGDDSTVDGNGLVNTNDIPETTAPPTVKKEGSVLDAMFQAGSGDLGTMQPLEGTITKNVDYANFDKYIDQPFSFTHDDVYDLRAHGQSTSEKWGHGLLKFPSKILTNVIGAVPGSVYGLGAMAVDLAENGPSASNLNAFFDNDFQRGLDGVNEWMDEELPNYYTKEEQEMNFWNSMGTANFWANDMTNGLSFVAGAVLSEMATGGLATLGVVQRSASLMKGMSRKMIGAGSKTVTAAQKQKGLLKQKQWGNGLVTARQLATGAGYEAGVEARHHLDSTVSRLTEEHMERNGVPPTQMEMAKIRDIATKSANGVFGANLALVGYSNYIMFPKIFGKGINASRGSYKGLVKEEIVDGVKKYRSAYKDFSKGQNIRKHAWKIAKTPLYEGFGEEGGQKWADLAGQHASSRFYRLGEDPSSMRMIGGLLNSMDDSFIEAYGTNESQKEIGIGVILAALGLPTFIKTNSQTEKREFGLGLSGGIFGSNGSIDNMSKERADTDKLVDFANSNPSAFESIKVNFDNMVRQSALQEDMDAAGAVDDIHGFKNAEHDAFFSFIYSRLKLGYFEDVVEDIKSVENMSHEDFAESFGYDTKNMTKEELDARKNNVIDKALERANKIKQVYEEQDGLFNKYTEKVKMEIAHTMSVAENLDEREEALKAKIEKKTGRSSIRVENKAQEDEKAAMSFKDKVKSSFNYIINGDKKAYRDLVSSGIIQEIKSELGIEEFTAPSQLVELHSVLANKASMLDKMLEDPNITDEQKAEIESQLNEITVRSNQIRKMAADGISEELSSEEAQLMDEWRQENPTGFAKDSEEVTKMLLDIKKVRARRHAFIDLYNELTGIETAKPKIQLMENAIQDIRKEDSYDQIEDAEMKRLYLRYAGEILEFDYTTKDGTIKKYRVRMEKELDSDSNPILTKIPTIEDAYKYKLAEEIKILEGKEDEYSKKRIQELQDKMAEMGNPKQTYKADFLKSAKNIKLISGSEILLERVHYISEMMRDEFGMELHNTVEKITTKRKEIQEIRDEVNSIRIQIRDSKGSRFGIKGQKGLFSIEGANKIIQKLDALVEDLNKDIVKLEVSRTRFFNKVQEIDFLVSEVGDPNLSNAARVQILNKLLQYARYDDAVKQTFYETEAQYNPILKDLLKTVDVTDKDGNIVGQEVVVNQDLYDQLAKDLLGTNITEDSLRYLSLMDESINTLQQELEGLQDLQTGLHNDFSQLLGYDTTTPGGKTRLMDSMDKRTKEYKNFKATEDEIQSILDKLDILTGDTSNLRFGEEARKFVERVEKIIDKSEAIATIAVEMQARLEFVEKFVANMTTPEIKTETENEVVADKIGNPSTRLGVMTDEEILLLLKDSSQPGVVYNYHSSILTTKMAKTAGNHPLILKRIDLLTALESPAMDEQLELSHLQAQARMFAISALFTTKEADYKMSDYNFQVVTRSNIIGTDLEDKVLFFDSRDGKYKRSSDYTGDLDPNIENIKLVLVDLKGNPVEFSGGIAYTNIHEGEVFDKNGVYKFAQSDLTEAGDLKSDAASVLSRFQKFRSNILSLKTPGYLTVSGTSKGMNSWINDENGMPDALAKAPVLNRIAKNRAGVKNVDLRVAKSDKDVKTEFLYTKSGLRGAHKVRNGFPYIIHNQTVIPAVVSLLSESQTKNIHNLLKLWATQQIARTEGDPKFKGQDANYLPGTNINIFHVIKDYAYFGKASKEREQEQYRFYIENDTIFFGDNSISVGELADPAENETLNQQFRAFLGTLTHQVNGFKVDATIKARKDAATAASKSKKFISPTYEEFSQVIVQDNLEVDTVEWSNYNTYLMADQMPDKTPRNSDDIPLQVNLVEDLTREKGMSEMHHMFPQVKARYTTFNASFEIFKAPKNTTKKKGTPKKDKKNVAPTVDKVVGGNYALKVNSDYSVNIKFGQNNFSFTVKVASLNADSKYTFKLVDSNGLAKEHTGAVLQHIIGTTEFYTGVNTEGSITKVEFGPGQTTDVEVIFTELNVKKEKGLPEGMSNGKVDDNVDTTEKTNPINKKSSKVLLNNSELKEGDIVFDENNDKYIFRGFREKDAIGGGAIRLEDKEGEIMVGGINTELYTEVPQQGGRRSINFSSNSQNDVLPTIKEQLEESIWFTENMPKDSTGKPLFTIKRVVGLIDGKFLGELTEAGNILLSMDAPKGAIYHESWHAATRFLISQDKLAQMYNEVRGLRGKATTYKGENKSLSSFTDKEADEYLAEEFREYALTDGVHTMGDTRETSFLDKIMDFLYRALKFFTGSEGLAEDMANKIYTGYFSKAAITDHNFDSNERVNMSVGPSSGFKANAVEGMTTHFFNVASREGHLDYTEIFDITELEQGIKAVAERVYGSPNTYTDGEYSDDTVYGSMMLDLSDAWDSANNSLSMAKTEEEIAYFGRQRTNIEDGIKLLQTPSVWESLKAEHGEYLKRWKVDFKLDEESEEDIQGRNKVDFKPANEVDPNGVMPKPLQLLIATLPRLDENGVLVMNPSGFARLADFGQTMSFLYKNLSNMDNPVDVVNKLKELSVVKPELKSLINRLGLSEVDNLENFNDMAFNDVRLVTLFLLQMDQAVNKYMIQSINRYGGRFFMDANESRIGNIIRDVWKLEFKLNVLDKGLGKQVGGEYVLDTSTKVTIDGVTRTYKEWLNRARTYEQDLALLEIVGIKFSNKEAVLSSLNSGENETLENALERVISAIKNNPNISDLYKAEIYGRMKTLIEEEIKNTSLASDLQHQNPEGKTVYGVSLKTYMDKMAHKFNNNNEFIEDLLLRDNYMNSEYLKRLSQGASMEIFILEGHTDVSTGRSKHMSKANPAMIMLTHANAILTGMIPFIRPADSKTEYAVKVGNVDLKLYRRKMISILQGYLMDEIRVSNKVNNAALDSKLRQVSKFSEKAKELRIFKSLTSIDPLLLSMNLSEKELLDLVNAEEVVKDLNSFLDRRITQASKDLSAYGIINTTTTAKGEVQAFRGIDKDLVEKAEKIVGKDRTRIKDLLIEQLVYNQFIGIVEQSKLFLGDLSLYSDLFKRTKGVIGTKKYPSTSRALALWMEENMPYLGYENRSYVDNLGNPAPVRAVVRQDVFVDSEYINDYKAIIAVLKPNDNPKDINDTMDSAYADMQEFDGGGIITLDAYRRLLNSIGQWSKRQEALYQKIMLSPESIMASDLAYFPPLKPQVWAPMNVDNIELKTFHKFALFPVHPELSKVVGNEASDGMKGVDMAYLDMLDNHIDYQIFESVTKVGGITDIDGNFESFYMEDGNGLNIYKPMDTNEDGSPSSLQEFDFEYFGIQVDIAAKKNRTTTMGTQTNSLMPVNIFSEGEVSEEYSGEFIPGQSWEQAIEMYHQLHNSIIGKDITKLINKLGLVETDEGFTFENGDASILRETLLEELGKRDMAEHIKRGITLLFNSDNKHINQVYDKTKIETMLYSIATSSVIKRKMPGTLAVLQSSTGFEVGSRALKQGEYERMLPGQSLQKLKFYRKPTGKAGETTLRMQVYLPHFFKEFLGEGLTITSEGIFNENGFKVGESELLEVIGFRIPTEGLNSIDAIEIVGFLPDTAGDAVIVPTEMVGKAGADYDIDKMTIYVPNYKVEKGLIKKISANYKLTDEDAAKRLETMRTSEFSSYISTLKDLVRTTAEITDKESYLEVIQAYDDTFSAIGALDDILESAIDIPEYKEAVENIRELSKDKKKNKAALKEARNKLASIIIHDERLNEEGGTKPKLIEAIKLLREQIKEIDANLLPLFSTLSITDQNTKAALQNELQDLMSDILLHPVSFAQLMNPVGAGVLKGLAENISDIRAVKQGTALEEDVIDTLSIGNIVKLTYRMQSGLGGTGIVAVNSTHHAKAQRAGLSVNPDYFSEEHGNVRFNFPGLSESELVSMSRSKDILGKRYISESLGMYITGYVDVTKDDFVFDINAGSELAPVHMLLLRAGVPLETVALFMSQPSIDEYVKQKSENQASHLMASSGFKSNISIISDIYKKLGSVPQIELALEDNLLEDMIGMSMDSFSQPINAERKVVQAQIFEDFLRYMDNANEMFMLTQSTNYDTSRLKNFAEVAYIKMMNRVVDENSFFINKSSMVTNAIIPGVRSNMIASYRKLFDITPGMYEELDYKSNKVISEFVEGLIYEKIVSDSFITKNDAVKSIEKFDNFLSAYVLHTTKLDYNTINEETKSLFQGPKSLPRRIANMRKDPRFANNLLIQEFYPVLQSFVDPKHEDYAVDSLNLMNKRLNVYDMNLLADAFEELEQLYPQIASDLIKFSVLQSGYTYSPSAFLHILPTDKVLKFTKPYFDLADVKNITESKLDRIHREFIMNSWDDPSVVRTETVRNAEHKKGFKAGMISLPYSNQYIVLTQFKEKVKAGIKSTDIFEKKLFEKQFIDGKHMFVEIPKRGIKGKLLEINASTTVINANSKKASVEQLKLNDYTVSRIASSEGSTFIAYNRDGLGGRDYVLSNNAHVKFISIGSFSKKKFLADSKIREMFGIESKGVQALEDLAKLVGFKTFASFNKLTNFASKNNRFYEISTIEAGYSALQDESIEEADSFEFEEQGANTLESILINKESLDREVQEVKDQNKCKTK